MAIYHFSVGHVSRSTRCTSVQSAAYITGENLHEERRNKQANYSNREDVFYATTLAPMSAKEDFKNTEKAWNLLENYEDAYAKKRYKTTETREKYLTSARSAMKVVVALPKELSSEIHKSLVLDFVTKNYVSKGHIVTVGIHNDEGNPHAHFQISRRKIEEDGTISYAKNREMCTVLGIKEQREEWAKTVNSYLEKEGLEERIDHRSYKEQGLNLTPTIHEGWYARRLESAGKESINILKNKEIREENKEKLSKYPELIFKELTANRATFSELDVVKSIQKRMENEQDLAQHAFELVMEKAIAVGHGFDRQLRFTTPEYYEKEKEVLDGLEILSATKNGKTIGEFAIFSYLNHYRLSGQKISDEQEKAVQLLCANSSFSVLVGRAGTGKTTGVLKPVVELHKEAGFKIMGMALSAQAAKNLNDETGAKSETVAHYVYQWNTLSKLKNELENKKLNPKIRHQKEAQLQSLEKELPTKNTLILLDEAGMVGTKDWHEIVKMTKQTGAKLIVCEDDHQYKAIDAGDVFRKALDVSKESKNVATLSTIMRQKIQWMRGASMQLSNLETTQGLMTYENKNCTKEYDSEQEMIRFMAKDYVQKVTQNSFETGLILTSTNKVRLALNNEIRSELQAHNLLEKDAFSIQGKNFSLGEKIVFLQNDKHQESVQSSSKLFAVKNGTVGKIEAVREVFFENNPEKICVENQKNYELTVRVSKDETVKFTLDKYQNFDHAYAMTGHKS
ncbi:MAG TPA: AAA family ATPase [Alphaproteobacteria bacterium]|nr:AAA family ATPase [Alphaproteobacteria bacterium]